MNRLRAYEDASRDHEQFEAEQIARDSDATERAPVDIDKRHAWLLVEELIAQDVVTPIPESEMLVHEPSDEVFRSEKVLAVFHKGWEAGAKSALNSLCSSDNDAK